MTYDIFISYAREDNPTARTLCSQLESEGLRVFLDCNCILGGQRFDDIIMRSLENSKIILILLSSISIKKGGYLAEEIQTALKYETNKIMTIIPLRIDDSVEMPSDRRLNDVQHIMMYPSWDNGFKQLLFAITAILSPKYEKPNSLEDYIINTGIILGILLCLLGLWFLI